MASSKFIYLEEEKGIFFIFYLSFTIYENTLDYGTDVHPRKFVQINTCPVCDKRPHC